jgi:tRNA pseudouridine32 synthase / 23S rRNA pseudouridine746 synthase
MSTAQAEILYQNDQLVVLNKPSGLSVLRDRSGASCLWDQLPDLLNGKPYQVHRIDKGTSGALLVARDAQTQKALTQAFHSRQVRKYYLAWVTGSVERAGLIDLPLRRGRKSRYRVAGQRADIVDNGRSWQLAGSCDPAGLASSTRMRPLRHSEARSLLLLQPLTGRTHQLRVHLSWIGHPILGDQLYGRQADPLQQSTRLQLHCHRLVVPGFGSYAAPLPPDWFTTLEPNERPIA